MKDLKRRLDAKRGLQAQISAYLNPANLPQPRPVSDRTMNRIAIIVIRTFLGLLFLAAGIPKVGAHLQTLAAVYSYQIVLPDWLATTIAHVLPWVEIGLGLALIAGLVMPLTLAATAIVLFSFTALTAQAWWRGLEIDCGCLDFSGLHPALAALGTPGGATLRNIVLLALTGLLAFLLRRMRRD